MRPELVNNRCAHMLTDYNIKYARPYLYSCLANRIYPTGVLLAAGVEAAEWGNSTRRTAHGFMRISVGFLETVLMLSD